MMIKSNDDYHDGENNTAKYLSTHLLVVSIFTGEGANELIQLGSVLVHSQASLEAISNTPFSAVTLSVLYQDAAENALQQAVKN